MMQAAAPVEVSSELSLRMLRRSEMLVVGYFVYTACLAVMWRLPASYQAAALATPVLLCALAHFETTRGNKATGVLREFLIPGLVLIAYWQVNWFSRGYEVALQRRWVEWDRMILDGWHARSAIESLGWPIPALLEFSYFMMYAIPPLALLVLYRNHLRSRVDQFLFTFLLGTLGTYALLPFVPTEAPRIAFPGQDLPSVVTLFRSLNVWLANGYDIRTSVFPSGHVTAAFSAAFGMLLAFPARKRFSFILLVFAAAITVTTIYGRYHYAMDALAGICMALIACGISRRVYATPDRVPRVGSTDVTALEAAQFPHGPAKSSPK